MKKTLFTIGLAALSATTFAQAKKPIAKKPVTVAKTAVPLIKTTLDSASYGFGMAMASSLKNNGLTSLNYDALIKGIKDIFGDGKTVISRETAQTAMNNLFQKISKEKSAPNIAEGKKFLEENKKKAGVQTTASGLQYEVLKAGDGIKPKATDTVLVHYKGTLLNGKQFDSSYDRKEPLALPLNGVIAGWTEGVQLMSVGSKYRFYIPYNLAYGERGAGHDIPPYSTLIFDIELLKVNGK